MTKSSDRSDSLGSGAQSAITYSKPFPWWKLAAHAVRGFGFLVGAAIALIYLALVWTTPPPDLSHARPGAVFGLYVGIPILIFAGPVWLCNWIAARIDPDQHSD